MEMRDLVSLVKESGAPILSSYMQSNLAGTVMTLIAKHYGVDNKFDTNTIADMIKDNPDKLKSLEYGHRTMMASLIMDTIEKMEPRTHAWLTAGSAVLCIVGFLVYLFYYVSH